MSVDFGGGSKRSAPRKRKHLVMTGYRRVW